MKLPIIELEDGYQIIFSTLKNRLLINSVIKIFYRTLNENKKHVILDFRECKPPSFPNIILTLTGIIRFYQNKHHFNIEILSKPDSYIEYVRIDNPYNVKEDKDYINECIFDKVIEFSSDMDVSFISENLLNQLQMQVVCEEGVLIGTSWCMNEIMDNVLLHSGIEKGYFMSQIHKRNKHLVIAIFDNGYGLYNTLKWSNLYEINSTIDAIRLSVQKGVTRDRTIGQGNGMWGLHQIISNNSGMLTIATGNSALLIDTRSDDLERYFGNLPFLSRDYQCTLIDFTIDFTKYININEVFGRYEPYELIQQNIEELTDKDEKIMFRIRDYSLHGTGTRSSGSKLRHFIINLYKMERKVILLDFDSLSNTATSFMDEFIGKLYQELGEEEFNKRYVVINASQYILTMIEYVRRQRLSSN